MKTKKTILRFIRVTEPKALNERPLIVVDRDADRLRNKVRDTVDRSRNIGYVYPINARQIADGILAMQRNRRK